MYIDIYDAMTHCKSVKSPVIIRICLLSIYNPVHIIMVEINQTLWDTGLIGGFTGFFLFFFLPFLDGINVSEEQQELPGAVLLSVREQEVVSGHTQRSSPRWSGTLSQHHVLHISRLNVL